MTIYPFEPKSLTVAREGWPRAQRWADLGAGITVGIIALPLSMALAIASGLPPERGLFTAIVAGFLVSALGGSRVQVGGPAGAFVVIVSGIVARHGYDGLCVATLMASAILVIMGLSGMGTLIKFIPYPVTTGFTTGIAVIIAQTQLKDFFANPAATAIGVASLAIILILRRVAPRVPGPLVAVVGASLAVWAMGLPVETIGTKFGGIPRTLPAPSFPRISLSQVRVLVPEATTIALLCAIESLLCAVVADGMTGFRHRSNTELMAQGVANAASILFGGMPATGTIARTAANIRSGGRTPAAGILHAAFLFVVLLVAAPLASAIPLPALSAILFVVAWNMAEVDRFRHLLRAPRSDVAVLFTTFGLTILVDLSVAVQVGMVLASLLFMRRMSEVTNIAKLSGEKLNEEHDLAGLGIPPGVEIYEVNGPLFFGVADRIVSLLGTDNAPPKAFVLDLASVSAIDASGIHALEELHDRCRSIGTTLLLSGLHAQPLFALEKAGLAETIGRENLGDDLAGTLRRAGLLAGKSVVNG